MTRDIRFHSRGVVGGIVLTSAALLVVCSEPYIKEGTWGVLVLEVLSYATFLSGLALRFLATLYLGGRKDHAIITEGPYSICRNPLYVGSFLIAVSAGLLLQSAIFALALALVVGFYMTATVPAEEKFLLERFGDSYKSYCQTVPRFWPRFSSFHSPPILEVNLKGLKRECKRALVWIWLPMIGELITGLRCEHWWPHWFRLL